MMKTLMVVALMAVFALTLGAQEKKAPGEHSMTGCLQKGSEPNSYLIDNVEGNGPKMIGVVSSTANLAPHVGHKIEVTGVAVPAAEAEKDKSVPKAPHYMKLSGIKMVSTTCP
jgi:hypothetical protein